ncbi:hypothetical protein PGN35_003310 [Nodosilinea sp. PGN35]|nr:hypothetical protein [Nodosilinea sp. TSF1-S3]MDF0365647.1 hypothetical protein [Nodosilinea sp. TSF1-S3]
MPIIAIAATAEWALMAVEEGAIALMQPAELAWFQGRLGYLEHLKF